MPNAIPAYNSLGWATPNYFRCKLISMNTGEGRGKRFALSGTDPFAALRYRNYRLFFTGQFVSMCGTWLQSVAQGWLVWKLTGNAFWVGVVTAAGSAPMLLSLAGGIVADRVDRRRLLLITQTLSLLLAALLGYLSLQSGLKVWHVILVAVALGLVNAFDVPARQSFVVEMVEREALMNAIAMNSMLFNGARIFGPALASLCIAVPWIGVPGCFFLNSASYVAAIIALSRIRVATDDRPTPGNPLEAAKEGIRYVSGTPVVSRLIVLLFVVGVFGWSIGSLLPPMADHVLHGNAGTFGWLQTSQGVGAVLGALLIAMLGDTPHKRAMVYGGLGVACLGLTVFSLSRLLPLSLVGMVLIGLGMILFSATGNTVVQTMVPDELRGRVMGVWALVFAGSTPVGSLLSGWMAHRWGAPAAIQVGVVMMLVAGALVYFNSHQARQRAARAANIRAA